MDTPRIPFILDTDTAQDDCVAMLLGLLDPVADLRGVTMVAGNVGFDRQVTNAVMTMATAGRLGEVPIFTGCTRPILQPWVSAEDVHGDGAGGLDVEIPEGVVSAEHGVDALLRLTAEAPGEVSIVAIGPLTNIALAAVKDRSFPGRVKSLYIMGGSNNGRGNITAAAEFNFYVDPEAAQVVFTAGFADIHVVTWDPVTLRDATYGRAEYDELCSLGTPLSRFFKKVCDTTTEFNESVGVPGSTHPDSLTVAALLHPEIVLEEGRYHVAVETASPLTRGYSFMAWDKYDLPANAHVVERADTSAFYEMLRAMLATPTTPDLEGLA